MTKAQYGHQQILAERAEREKELRMIAESRAAADPRYVQDVIGFIWDQILDRKLRMREMLQGLDRRRVETLIGLLA